MKPKVLVTGANGQLASCIRDLESSFPESDFIFTNTLELDVTNLDQSTNFFIKTKVDWCINCAAYTAVDKAENDEQNATNINVTGVKNLAVVCQKNKTILIHISTDFVFDGITTKPYKETDITNPKNIYGLTKLKGEHEIINSLEHYFIIRTSWLYSEYGNNFMKTMIKTSKEKAEISVVNDQIGTPTYASDLAKVILEFIVSKNKNFGIYHYSNEGKASWYDFAKAIFEEKKIKIKLHPIKTEFYPTPAKRPRHSVLDKTKIKHNLNIEIPNWEDSLKTAIQKLNGQEFKNSY